MLYKRKHVLKNFRNVHYRSKYLPGPLSSPLEPGTCPVGHLATAHSPPLEHRLSTAVCTEPRCIAKKYEWLIRKCILLGKN